MKFLVAVVLGVVMSSNFAVAQDGAAGQMFHVEVFGGGAKATGDFGEDLKIRPAYGAQMFVDVTPTISVGAFYSTNVGEVKDFEGLDYRISYYGISARMSMEDNVFALARIGMSSHKVKLNFMGNSFSAKSEENPVIAAIGFGKEFSITPVISFAPYVNYVQSFETGDAGNTLASFGIVEAMASLRFNF